MYITNWFETWPTSNRSDSFEAGQTVSKPVGLFLNTQVDNDSFKPVQDLQITLKWSISMTCTRTAVKASIHWSLSTFEIVLAHSLILDGILANCRTAAITSLHIKAGHVCEQCVWHLGEIYSQEWLRMIWTGLKQSWSYKPVHYIYTCTW